MSVSPGMAAWRLDSQRDPEEIDIFVATKVAIYYGSDEKPTLEDQSLLLTSHRITLNDGKLAIHLEDVQTPVEAKAGFLASSPKIILQVRIRSQVKKAERLEPPWKCPACEEQNEGGSSKCYLCGTLNPTVVNRTAGSGHKTFLTHLNEALSKQAWKAGERQAQSMGLARTFSPAGSGVTGIIRKANTDLKRDIKGQDEAFGDLDALMSQAGEMAKLAETLVAKLNNSKTGDASELGDGEDKEFKRLMADLGLGGAQATISTSSSAYHSELAKQLSTFTLRLFSLRSIQMATLADVYCYFNRARGTDLVSPQDLAKAASLLRELQQPIRMRCLASGLLVLQSASFADDQLADRILSRMQLYDAAISASDLAQQESISVQLAAELLTILDQSGRLCRDQSASGPHYYANLILG